MATIVVKNIPNRDRGSIAYIVGKQRTKETKETPHQKVTETSKVMCIRGTMHIDIVKAN